jgi:hypothetical protein
MDANVVFFLKKEEENVNKNKLAYFVFHPAYIIFVASKK